MSNEESPTVFLLEEWRSYTNAKPEWHTVPSGFTLHTVGQAVSFAEHRARQCPGVYRIAVYRRVGATEVGI